MLSQDVKRSTGRGSAMEDDVLGEDYSFPAAKQSSNVVRRRLALLIIVLFTACLDPAAAPIDLPPGTSWAVRRENARSGAVDWDAGLYATNDSRVKGFVLPFSAIAGDTLHLFVSAWSTTVATSLYRLGWYDGMGARLVARHIGRAVVKQSPCSAPVPGPSICDWAETDRFVIDAGWVPGVYLAKFADNAGGAHAVPFIVRSSHYGPLLVIMPFATYQAYNDWNGTSLYVGLDSLGKPSRAYRAFKVSFARPLAHGTLKAHFLGLDYLLVRWLEQNAYDVTYIADYDFHLGRGADPQARAWLFAGHSEYWTWPMWSRAIAGRAQGIGLGFLGGNDIYWTIRFENSPIRGLDAPVVVCYRDTLLDPQGEVPGLATVPFRSKPNNTPENGLVGVMTVPPAEILNPPVDLVVANGSDPLFAGTGLSTGEHIQQALGWEGDRLVNNGSTPPGVRVLFQSSYTPLYGTAHTALLQGTVYVWPTGNMVYASGDVGFAWGLSTYGQHVANPGLQAFLKNVLRAFVEGPGPK